MAVAPLSYFPQSITSGDTTLLLLNLPNCPASGGTATLILNKTGSAPITCTGSASGDNFAFTITAAQSTTMAAGAWTWTARYTESGTGYVYSGGDGDFTVLANPASTLTKSSTEQQLDAANTALLTLLANPDQSVSFNGQSFTKENQNALLDIVYRLESKLAAERNAAAGLRGDPVTRSIRPYFV
jgi:hypothetical protein